MRLKRLRINLPKAFIVITTLMFLYLNTHIQLPEDSIINQQIMRRIASLTNQSFVSGKVTKDQSKSKTADYHYDWVEVNGSDRKLFLYSAFHDTRTTPPSVRLIVIVRKRYQIKQCQIWTNNGKYHNTTAKIKKIRENWGMAYSAAFVLCTGFTLKEKDVITKVGIYVANSKPTAVTLIDVVSLQRSKWEGEFSVCVKSFHYEYNRAVWLVEFIELHRIMGVKKFFFYNHTVGKDVEKVLQYYEKEGIADISNWTLPVKTQKEIRTEGLFAALNDCNLRNVGRYNYTLMIDLDEFIIPRKVDNYKALINSLGPKKSAFVFMNVFFYLYFENDTEASRILYESPNAVGGQLFGMESEGPYLLTGYKTVRLVTPHAHGKRSKYIVRPDRVTECGNHVAWEYVKGKKDSVNVPQTEAVVHHYRICEYGGFECLKSPTEVDRTAHKYLPALIQSLATVCSEIFPETGKCPTAPPLGSPW